MPYLNHVRVGSAVAQLVEGKTSDRKVETRWGHCVVTLSCLVIVPVQPRKTGTWVNVQNFKNPELSKLQS